jgi:UDP-N-acetylmuramate dehydrogenase
MNMADLFEALRGQLRRNAPMYQHTSWRVGGPAERVYIPADVRDFANFLRSLPAQEAVHVIGLGSNLLVRDGGIRGTVVFTHRALKQLRVCDTQVSPFIPSSSPFTLYAEAGVASPIVARMAARHALAGGEFLAGIPGTVGGALKMNAGCYGRETWEVVERVLTVNREGRFSKRLPEDFDIGYRRVALKQEKNDLSASSPLSSSEEFFAAAWFRFLPGARETSLKEIRGLLSKRIGSQPLSIPNAGSVFRNPPADHAARLIEACGLKGAQVGGAIVSPKHANFIVNCGKATAADIENLIETVHAAVLRQTGINLVREVEIVGERQ